MEGTESEILRISKINSAALINLRISYLWDDANKHSRAGLFSSWNADLDRIWCELGGDVIEGDGNDTKFKEINEKLAGESPIRNWVTQSGFKQIEKGELQKQNKQYQILIRKELFLRRLQNKQGKGTAYEEDDDFE